MAASPVRPASAPRSLQEGGIMRIPLHKRQHAVAAEKRLAHERERVRRRAQELPAATSNDSADHLVQGALAFSEAPLGVGYGTHYAEIYMGVPAQRASVIVDTGSHLTALPCSTCMDCGQHTDPLFDVSKSTTARYLACQAFGSCNSCQEDRCYISQSYTEGSMWQAVVVDELVWVGGFSGEDADAIVKHYGVRFPLGCQTKETGLFITQKENGIMGMGRHSKTVMAHMLSAGRLEHDIFSLCFDHSGGEMVLGGVDYSHHTTDVAYTPLLPSKSSFYPVRLKDIRVGGTTLGVPEDQLNTGKGVIVDSGTTDTFFVSSASRSFQQLFEATAGRKYSETKMMVTAEELAELPTITVVLAGMPGSSDGDIELEIPAEKYLTPSDNGKYYYGNFHFSERTGGVLGASSMVGLDVIFDSENERIGFAESLCGKGAASWKNATISSGSGSGSDITSPTGLSNAATSFDSTGSVATSERRSSPAMGTFIAEVLIITLLGIAVGVVLWTRRRKRSWAAIPDVESSRGVRSATTTPTSPSRREEVDDEAPRPSRVLSPPRQNAARKAPSPKFVIGDSDDEDLERLGGELTEL